MISSQILMNTIEGIRSITGLDIAVMDTDGREVVSTAPVFQEAALKARELTAGEEDSLDAGDFQLFKVYDERALEYILAVRADFAAGHTVGSLAAFQLRGLLGAFKEHYDRDSFMKNLLLDNLLLVDIYERAKKLRIVANAPRIVMMVELEHSPQQKYSWELILKREKFLKEKLYVQNILCNAIQSVKH